ncbi:uracil-DNA glycosylase family protein [Methyloversatilis sp. XJ19-13]|uniref:uracil-DNA glycosylase family protein n=1 Tax=Methyloversatilis sp. XJ19-13 TaxID=2963430 RepID=UPI00211BBA7A|nr:uracil-DNA glycosylase family protein [Methyloversatilis sp. XJ19-13]MCQ9374924.1 uracil-DNA glycosylase family protein [Methyloversatilis sp. XJ19-13]
MDDARQLIWEAATCSHCAALLSHPPRPVFQYHPSARILIAGQAPGARVHASGVPFDDASGDRLRDWLGVDQDTFYDPARFAILPMGFCYPGRSAQGDLPPRPECARLWRARFMDGFERLGLTVLLGAYSHIWHLGLASSIPVTETVANWRRYGPAVWPLPHPSPRNNRWLAQHPWFAGELLPALRTRVALALDL